MMNPWPFPRWVWRSRPQAEHLPGYLDALRRGWSPNTEHVGFDQAAIDRVTRDPQRFIELCDDREAAGGPIELPDGPRSHGCPA